MVRVLAVMAAAAVAVASVFVVLNTGSDEPRLRIDDSVAADFAEVAEETWDRFLAAFPAHVDCIGDITLAADYDLDDRAKYDPGRAEMAVRVPGPRVLLERAVAHELGHHLEFSCDAHHAMRPAFLAALGRDQETPWFAGEEPDGVPSEVFAEAVVEIVLEDYGVVHTRIGLIPHDAVEVVLDWSQ